MRLERRAWGSPVGPWRGPVPAALLLAIRHRIASLGAPNYPPGVHSKKQEARSQITNIGTSLASPLVLFPSAHRVRSRAQRGGCGGGLAGWGVGWGGGVARNAGPSKLRGNWQQVTTDRSPCCIAACCMRAPQAGPCREGIRAAAVAAVAGRCQCSCGGQWWRGVLSVLAGRFFSTWRMSASACQLHTAHTRGGTRNPDLHEIRERGYIVGSCVHMGPIA
jgi:hypothetical protein